MYGTGLDSGNEVLDSDSEHGTVPDSATKCDSEHGTARQCYRAWHEYYGSIINYNFVWRDYDKLWEIPEFADE